MANPEHVEIVKQGAEAIRKWREKNPYIGLDLREEDLTGADFSHADLSFANLSMANVSEADLCEAQLYWACLQDTNFSRARLHHADLSWSDLSRASLTAGELFHANLTGANLTRADLSYANLHWGSLGFAVLHQTDLTRTDLTAVLCSGAIFAELDLSDALGLDKMSHIGPSTVGVDTLFKSKGKIPEIFLRGCGVPERLIELLPSLIGAAIEFYTCFISFTEADDAFSERLYNDLQGSGVRCWRWKEDAKWGKSLMGSIDQAVRVYDKLIVICSENSLKSPAVLREIERALQKEDALCRQGKEAEVLFPIRLDDYIFEKWEHERKADIIKKHVGDFRNWKDPESYKKALDRLIRDLRAEKSPEEA